jgi:hypothetical protein
MDKITSLIHFSGVSNSSGFGGFSPNVAASQSPRTRQGSWPWPRILRTERRKPSGWTKCPERVEPPRSVARAGRSGSGAMQPMTDGAPNGQRCPKPAILLRLEDRRRIGCETVIRFGPIPIRLPTQSNGSTGGTIFLPSGGIHLWLIDASTLSFADVGLCGFLNRSDFIL